MSGGRVFRCRVPDRVDLALKRWPAETPRSRVQQIHQVIMRVRQAGCDLVPRFQSVRLTRGRRDTVLSCDNAHWDLCQWIDGVPLNPSAGPDQIRAGARAIAQFHAAAKTLGRWNQPPPAVRTRLRRVRQLDALLPRALDFALDRVRHPELAIAVTDAIALLEQNWQSIRQQVAQRLARYSTIAVETQYVLRDIHREHVLYEKRDPGPIAEGVTADEEWGPVRGLIDFDAVRVDTVATDLARWVSSFLVASEDPEAIWEAAMAGFRDEKAFPNQVEDAFHLRLARDLCFAGVWISLANWVVWIWQGRQFPPGASEVASRISDLIHRTQHV